MLPDPETHASLNDRRSFIKMLAAAPLFVTLASRSLAETVAATKAKPLGGNVYSRLGVRPFINGRGTWTYLSGSLELPEAREAAEQASRQFVDMFELQRAAGKRLAELSGAESGMVTSGSAGAMASATAACIAG
ncbi:MAG: D-glucosaminate-6-phosphate ammonia-lyase, partial [Acidobacteriaceae bacterium]|nr:D-glucosaminate-6-phosphate ammonia-lyase [Acidobacteriaceae bacterium]